MCTLVVLLLVRKHSQGRVVSGIGEGRLHIRFFGGYLSLHLCRRLWDAIAGLFSVSGCLAGGALRGDLFHVGKWTVGSSGFVRGVFFFRKGGCTLAEWGLACVPSTPTPTPTPVHPSAHPPIQPSTPTHTQTPTTQEPPTQALITHARTHHPPAPTKTTTPPTTHAHTHIHKRMIEGICVSFLCI